MTIYTVHVPPARGSRAGSDPMRAVFVKEGFCWPAFVVPLPWLVLRGMWIAAAFYVIAIAAAVYVAREPGLQPLAVGIAVFVPLLLGFEGNDLRRWSLGLRGHELAGVVDASSPGEAEIRFFSNRAAPRAAEPPPLPSSLPPATPVPPDKVTLLPPSGVVGLFPNAEGAS